MPNHYEAAHARHATRPRELSWTAWKDVLYRVKREIGDDNLALISAGVAFYTLLSLFPMMATIVALWGIFANSEQLMGIVSLLESFVSPGAAEVVGERLERLQGTDSKQLGWAAAGTLLFSLWSARRGMNAMIIAHNIVYEEQEKRGFFKRIGVSIVLTLSAILLLIVALAAIVIAGLVPSIFGFYEIIERLIQAGIWLGIGALFAFGLAALYRFAPNRRRQRWRWVSVGAVVATVLWLLMSIAFSVYVEHFASYDETYGTLGGAVVLMMWLFLSVFAVLLGGELNSELEHQTARDSTVGPEKPLGRRGAYVADTVGKTFREMKDGTDEPEPNPSALEPLRRGKGEGAESRTNRQP